MKSERFRMTASFIFAGLVIVAAAIASPIQTMGHRRQIVSRQPTIFFPESKDEIVIMKPPPPPPIIPRPVPKPVPKPKPIPLPPKPHPVKPDPTQPPSSKPGSSLSDARSVVDPPPGGYQAGEYDRRGNTAGKGKGSIHDWPLPSPSSYAKPTTVIPHQQQVIITRLKHTLSNYHVYDNDSLVQLENKLNGNNPEMRFTMNRQQSFSPYGHILLIIGEDPQLALTSGRCWEDLTDSFTEKEKEQLKKYVENGGIIIIMEATPHSDTSGFQIKMRQEMKRISMEQWEGSRIFFEEDFIKQFNQSNDYSYFGKILTAILDKQIN